MDNCDAPARTLKTHLSVQTNKEWFDFGAASLWLSPAPTASTDTTNEYRIQRLGIFSTLQDAIDMDFPARTVIAGGSMMEESQRRIVAETEGIISEEHDEDLLSDSPGGKEARTISLPP